MERLTYLIDREIVISTDTPFYKEMSYFRELASFKNQILKKENLVEAK